MKPEKNNLLTIWEQCSNDYRFLSETMEVRRKWQNILKVLIEKKLSTQNSIPGMKGKLKNSMEEFFGLMGLFCILIVVLVTQMYKCIKNL